MLRRKRGCDGQLLHETSKKVPPKKPYDRELKKHLQ
jgi:hypothetical protein